MNVLPTFHRFGTFYTVGFHLYLHLYPLFKLNFNSSAKLYLTSYQILQVYVYGESIKSSLIAVVVLDEEYLALSHPQEFANIPISKLPDSKEFSDFVLDSMLKLGSEELNSLEQVFFGNSFDII